MEQGLLNMQGSSLLYTCMWTSGFFVFISIYTFIVAKTRFIGPL